MKDVNPTQYFRAMRTSPDRFKGLTDTQKAILFDLVHLLPFTGQFSGKSRYRAAAILKRDRKAFNRNLTAILDWQQAQKFEYIAWDKNKGLKLTVDPTTFMCGVVSPIGVWEPHSSGSGRPIVTGSRNPIEYGAGSPNSKSRTNNRNKEQNQDQKPGVEISLDRELPQFLIDRILCNSEEQRNGTC